MSARYHRAGLIGVLALLLAVATGCGHRPPAPVEERSLAQPKHRVEVNGSYRVVPGDTLHGIAFSYGLDAAQLAKWNGISSPFTIYPDQLIRLTPPDPKRSAT